MKVLILVLIAYVLPGCGHIRVLVRDCQEIKGSPDLKNCEYIQEL